MCFYIANLVCIYLNTAQTLEQIKDFYQQPGTVPLTLQIPENPPDFQPVSGLESIRYVHAALWQGDNVRITALKRQGKLDDILCVLWYSADQSSNFTIVRALVKDLPSYGVTNSCAYIKCFLHREGGKQKLQTPVYVGLINRKSPLAGHRVLLQVENRDMDPNKVNQVATTNFSWPTNGKIGPVKRPHKNRVVEFTVCIPTMFNYGNAAQLVEKIEMVRLMGAGRVVLYDTNTAPNVRAVLGLYTHEWAEGRETLEVVVHSWNIPRITMHYGGQMAAADDCLHRYGWLSKYMVFNDLDELIVPLRHENWSQLIAERERLRPGNAAFMFLCAVVNKDHFSPANGFLADAHLYGSSVLGFTQRETFLWPPTLRSKLILNPRKVESIEVHQVHEAYGTTDIIPEHQGLLYHYRWPFQECGSEIEDLRVASRFGRRLLARLKSVWSRLPRVSLGYKLPNPDGTKETCSKSFKQLKGSKHK